MPDLPATLRCVYHATDPYPRDLPLAECYAGLHLPGGRGDRPFVYVNMVQTFDGQAVLNGKAYTIGTDVDHHLFRQLRVHADAVLYGAGTLRLDDVIVTTHPALRERRVREGRPPNPPAFVVSATAEFSDEVFATKKFFQRTDLERVIVTTPRASPQALDRVRAAGVRVEIMPTDVHGHIDLAALLRALHARGIEHLLCEGGPTLNAELAREHLLDELFVTTSLRLGGEAGTPRIFSAPVLDRPLILISELHFVTAEGVREIYFRFRLPG